MGLLEALETVDFLADVVEELEEVFESGVAELLAFVKANVDSLKHDTSLTAS